MTDAPAPTPDANPTGLRAVYRARADLDYLVELLEGEVTEEVEAAEARLREDVDTALGALLEARSLAAGTIAAAEAERERLDRVIERNQRVVARADHNLQQLVEQLVAGSKRRSITYGTHKLALRKGSEFVAVDEDVDPEALPPHLQRWTEPKPPTVSVDKSAAKKAIKAGEQIPGLRLCRRKDTLTVE